MERSINRVKIFLMTIMSLVIMLTGVTFVRLDKNQTQSQSPTVVSASSVVVPDIQLPEGVSVYNVMDRGYVGVEGYEYSLNLYGINENYRTTIEQITTKWCFTDSAVDYFVIGDTALNNCTNLKVVEIYSEKELRLSANIFDGCSSLETIYLNAPTITFADGVNPFGGNYGNGNCELIICDSVTTIPDNMFKNATSITSVTIPSSVTQIGIKAFANCTKLQELNYDASVVHDCVSDSAPFASSGDSSGVFVKIGSNVPKLPKSLFYSLRINQVEFLENSKCTSIGRSNFYGTNFLAENLILPDSVTTLESFSIAYTSRLKNIKLGTGLTYIANDAFLGSTGINNITYNCTTETPFNLTSIFASSTQDIHLTIGEDVTVMPTYYTQASTSGNFKVTELTFNCTNIPSKAGYDNDIVKTITIGEGVTSIGEDAFKGCNELTKIYYNAISCANYDDNVLNYIYGPFCFDVGNAPNRNLYIGSNVTKIPDSMFASSEIVSVEYVGISQLEEIGEYAFFNNNLTEFTFPASFKRLSGISAFWYCNIQTVNYNATATEDFEYTPSFSDSSGIIRVNEINIGSNVTKIPEEFFMGCNLVTTLTIPESVTSIGNNAFKDCTGLTTINYNPTLAEVGYPDTRSAPFVNAGSTNGCVLNIGAGVTKIRDYMFAESNISEINFEENSQCTDIGDWAFSDTCITHLTLPDSVKTIGNGSLLGIVSLTTVTLGENLTTVNSYAFPGCSAITSITYNCTKITPFDLQTIFSDATKDIHLTIGEDVTVMPTYYTEGGSYTSGQFNVTELTFNCEIVPDSACNVNFVVEKINLSDNVTSIGYCAFWGSNNITTVNLGTGIITIGDYAFSDCTGITSITIPDKVTSIGVEAFRSWDGLTSVTLGKGLTTIGDNAFSGCSNITSITYNCTTTTPFNLQTIFSNSTKDIHLTIGEDVTKMPTYYTSGEEYTSGKFNVTEITFNCATIPLSACSNNDIVKTINLSDNVITIDGDSFWSCGELTSVTLGEGLTTIGSQAFTYCTSLTSFPWDTIKDSLTTIGEGAFQGCIGLTSVTITENVESIGNYAFGDCYYITDVYYNATKLDAVNYCTFEGAGDYVSGITVHIGDNVTKIANNMFYGLNVAQIQFAENNKCETIGSSAFAYTELGSIVLPEGIKTIGNCAFWSAISSAVTLPESLETIESGAFMGCVITTITIPKNVTTLEHGAFKDCQNLVTINFNAINCNDNNIAEDSCKFSGPINLTINIGENVKRIPANIFASLCTEDGTPLVSQINFLGDKCTEIGENAFYGVYIVNGGSSNINIPASVVRIGKGAFNGNKVDGNTFSITMLGKVSDSTRSTIPTLVSDTSLGVDRLYVPYEDLTLYKSADYYGNDYNVGELLPYGYEVTFKYNDNSTADNVITLDVVDGVVMYEKVYNPTRTNYIFDGWYLDENLTYKFNCGVGIDAIGDYSQISIIDFEGPTTLYAKWAYGDMDNDGDLDDDDIDSIDWSMMYTYDGDNTITGLNEENAIGIVDFVIPVRSSNGYVITEIASNSFYENSRIQSITFEEGSQIEYIGPYAFYGCSNLTTLDLTNATSLQGIDGSAFKNCSIMSDNFVIPNSVTDIGLYAFDGNTITAFSGLNNGTYLTENGLIYSSDKTILCKAPNIIYDHVEIDSATTIISEYAFRGCYDITSIYGENVTCVGEFAFQGSSLEYFDFPKLETIQGYAFAGTNLKIIQLASSVTSIGYYAFSDCNYLTAIVIGGSLATNRSEIPTIPDDINSVADNESDIIVYVASDDLSLYQQSNWNRFKLVGLDIESVQVHKVTIDLDGGSGYSSVYYIIHGDTIDLSIDPTKLGYSFKNWQIYNGSWVGYDDSTPVTSDIELQVVWDKINYTINYDVDGGVIDGDTQTFTIDDFGAEYNTAVSVKEPERIGHKFIGWYTNSEYDSAKVTAIKFANMTYNQLMGTEQINLYAKWEIQTFTMVFEESDTYTITLDSSTLNPVPWDTNFGFVITFSQGYTQNTPDNIKVNVYDSTGETFMTELLSHPNGSTDLHYVINNVKNAYTIKIDDIVINKYSVTFESENLKSEYTGIPNSITIDHGKSIAQVVSDTTTLNSPKADGYIFKSWHLKNDANVYNFSTPVTGNVELHAKWEIDKYTLTYHLNGSDMTPVKIDGYLGTDTKSYQLEYAVDGSYVLITDVTRTGYRFIGWYDNDQLDGDPITSIPSINILNDLDFYAKWEERSINLEFDYESPYYGFEEDRSITISDLEDAGGTIKFDDVYAVKPGYTFVGWWCEGLNTFIRQIDLTNFDAMAKLSKCTIVAKGQLNTYNVTTILVFADSYSEEEAASSQVIGLFDNNQILITSVACNGNLDFTIKNIHDQFSQCLFELTVSYSYTQNGSYTSLENSYCINGVTGDIFIKIEGIRINKYTVTFVSNGGTPVGQMTDIPYNSVIDAEDKPTPTRPGYTFAGWYRDQKFNYPFEFSDSIGVSQVCADTTLYAKWEVNNYTATLSAILFDNKTDGIDDKDKIKIYPSTKTIEFNIENAHEKSLLAANNFTIDGYQFVAFYLVPKGTSVSSYEFKKADIIENLVGLGRNADIIARFDIATYNIYYAIDAGENNPSNPATYTINTSTITLADATKNGYVFAGWEIVDKKGVKVTTIEQGTFGDIYLVATFTLLEEDYWEVSYYVPDIFDYENEPIDDDIVFEGIKWRFYSDRAVEKENSIYNTPSAKVYVENLHPGYTFVGWYTRVYDDQKGEFVYGSKFDTKTTKNDNISLYAKFELNTYKITYEANVSDFVNDNDDENLGYDLVTVKTDFNLEDARKNGYTFEGWYTNVNKNGNDYDFTNAIKVTRIYKQQKDITLVAKFTPFEYEIVYNLNGGILKDNVELIKTYYVTDGTIILPTDEQISKFGYIFNGWETGAGEIIEQITMDKISNYTLTAKFTAIEYTVTFVDEKAEAPEDIKYTIESSVQTLSHEGGEAGYVFIGWYDENDHKVEYVGGGHIVGDTLTAKYNLIPYDIDYNTNGGELENQYFEMIRKYYVTSSIIVLPKLVKVGYTFDGWTNVANPSKVINRIDPTTCTNYELTAKFTAIEYTVTFVDEKAEAPEDIKYTIESSVQTLTHMDVGYPFLGWFDDAGNKVESIGGVRIVGDKLTARYGQDPKTYNIGYDLKDGTMPNGSVSPLTYTVEDEIILSSPSKPGFTFLYWKDKNTQKILEDNKIKNMFGQLALEAVYKEFTTSVYYKITYIVDGDERVIDYIEHNGTLKDVVIPEKAHYDFNGLFTDPSCTEAVDPNMKVTQDIQLYAKYTPKPFNIEYKFVDVNGTVLKDVNNPNAKEFNVENQIIFEKSSLLGYTFVEYRIDNVPVKSTMGYYEDIEVTIVLEATVYRIAYILNGGMQNGRNLSEYTINNKYVPLHEPTKNGYEFEGWFDSETNMKVTVIDAETLKNYTLIAKWRDPNAVAGNTNNNNNIGTIIAIAVIGAIIVFAGIGIVLLIKMKHSSVTIKADKNTTNIHDINAVYNMEKKQYNMTEENRRRYEANLEKRNEQKDVGKFLGGMANDNNNDPYRNHGSVPHNIPTNPQNNPNNNTNGSNDQNKTDGQ